MHCLLVIIKRAHPEKQKHDGHKLADELRCMASASGAANKMDFCHQSFSWTENEETQEIASVDLKHVFFLSFFFT